MLVLSRKKDESIRIGDDITVTVVRIGSNRVQVGIEAPNEYRILRGELQDGELHIVSDETVPKPVEQPPSERRRKKRRSGSGQRRFTPPHRDQNRRDAS